MCVLTAEVEQMGEEEGVLVKVLDGKHDGSVQAAAQGLLGATLVCYEGLQHCAHHVQLGRWTGYVN